MSIAAGGRDSASFGSRVGSTLVSVLAQSMSMSQSQTSIIVSNSGGDSVSDNSISVHNDDNNASKVLGLNHSNDAANNINVSIEQQHSTPTSAQPLSSNSNSSSSRVRNNNGVNLASTLRLLSSHVKQSRYVAIRV